MFYKLWNDETGVIISAELVLVLTIAVLAMIVGLNEVAVAVNTELNDLSNAIGSLSQSFSYTGFTGSDNGGTKVKSTYAGGFWQDMVDDCDTNTTCDIVVGAPTASPGG